MISRHLTNKKCDRCGSSVPEEYYTLQITAGEPLRDVIAEEDCQLCLNCRIEFHQWLEAKRAGASIKPITKYNMGHIE